MKAAVFHGPREPLHLEDLPDPTPGPGEVLVRVAACGVCHTDLHYIDHGTPTFKKPPLILGHEISGRIAGRGQGVTTFQDGDPVLLPAVLTCGNCRPCRTGRENICEAQRMFGNHFDGGYAEYAVAPARDVFPLPAELPLAESAIIADALTTPYHAVVHRARVMPGEWVAVIGCGGIGLNVVQLAALVGGRVIAIDLREEKLAWATRLGAAHVLDASKVPQLEREVRRLTGGGVDCAIEAVGNPATQAQAFACLRSGGRLVLVGYSTGDLALNAGRTMFREIEVRGSLGCRPIDYPLVIELARGGRLKVAELVTHQLPLARIEEAFAALRAGTAVRAIVLP